MVELNNSSTKGLSELLDDEDKQKLDLLKKIFKTFIVKTKSMLNLFLLSKIFSMAWLIKCLISMMEQIMLMEIKRQIQSQFSRSMYKDL